jgi:hypothetical protein
MKDQTRFKTCQKIKTVKRWWTLQDDSIIIQGDYRDKIMILKLKGFKR